MLQRVGRVASILVGVFSPPACFNCGDFASFDAPLALCGACDARWELNAGPFCDRCGRTLVPGPHGDACRSESRPARPVYFALPYRGMPRKLIQRFKAEKADYLAPVLKRAIERFLAQERPHLAAFETLVPIPSHDASFFMPAWSGSERVAEILSSLTGLPVRRLLKRVRRTAKQSLLSKPERRENVRGAFGVRTRGELRGSFLLVDDVLTTGYTADACAAALKERGATAVGVFAAARGELA